MSKVVVIWVIVIVLIVLIASIFAVILFQPNDIDEEDFELEYTIVSQKEETIVSAKLHNKSGHILKIECVDAIKIEVVDETESFSNEETQIRRIEYLWAMKTQTKKIDSPGKYKVRVRCQFTYKGKDIKIEKDVSYFENN